MKGYIGPFTREDGSVIEEEPAEVLNQEYYKIFLKPGQEETIPEEYFDSQKDLPEDEDKWLENITFSEKDIKKAIMGKEIVKMKEGRISLENAKKRMSTILKIEKIKIT